MIHVIIISSIEKEQYRLLLITTTLTITILITCQGILVVEMRVPCPSAQVM